LIGSVLLDSLARPTHSGIIRPVKRIYLGWFGFLAAHLCGCRADLVDDRDARVATAATTPLATRGVAPDHVKAPAPSDVARAAAALMDGMPSELGGVVAVYSDLGTAVKLCTGIVLLPNLVLTARHCLDPNPVSIEAIDCDASVISDPPPSAAVRVIAGQDIDLAPEDARAQVSEFLLPEDNGKLCGEDIALLLLDRALPVASAVVTTTQTNRLGTDRSVATLAGGAASVLESAGAYAGTSSDVSRGDSNSRRGGGGASSYASTNASGSDVGGAHSDALGNAPGSDVGGANSALDTSSDASGGVTGQSSQAASSQPFTFTAVGYGLFNGDWGRQRERRDARLLCIGQNCADTRIVSNEFLAQSGACEGDSGGPARDTAGAVFAIAVRSTADCSESAYLTLDGYREWLASAVEYAAERGGFERPAWTKGPPSTDTAILAAGAPGTYSKDLRARGGCAVSSTSRGNSIGALWLAGAVVLLSRGCRRALRRASRHQRRPS
jgi:hypothetical protein